VTLLMADNVLLSRNGVKAKHLKLFVPSLLRMAGHLKRGEGPEVRALCLEFISSCFPSGPESNPQGEEDEPEVQP
jgi:hypothetical protein